MNNVVLGDLELYKGNDVLKFENNGYQYASFAQEVVSPSGNFSISSEMTLTINGGSNQSLMGIDKVILDNRNIFVLKQHANSKDISLEWRTNNITKLLFVSATDEFVNIDIICVDGLLTLTINGISDSIYHPEFATWNLPTGFNVGNRGIYPEQSTCTLKQLSLNSSYYIQNGDFGSLTLIDHSGNGNDGIINDATWWKQGVDEVFSTPQLYKSSFDVPMADDQLVTYTDALPFYNTRDSFWNPYNIDDVYSFSVNHIGIGKKYFSVVDGTPAWYNGIELVNSTGANI